MDALIIVLLVALLGIAAVALVWLLSQRRPAADAEAQRLEQQAQRIEQQLLAMKSELSQAVGASQQTVLQQVNSVDQKLNQRLDAVQSSVSQSMTGTNETIRHVSERLGELAQSTQQMLEVGRDISSLQDILRAPKLRGGFGELQLERILSDCGLPSNSYQLQHQFRTGSRVDAVISIGGGLVPIDSKFPMEGFNRVMAIEDQAERAKLRRQFLREVQKHVDAIGKYILPDEGTFDFAIMFIPAEGVYQETFFAEDIVDDTSVWMYAMNRRVIPVSPSTFFAYLYALVLGLRGLQIDRRAREIINHLGRLSGDLGRVREDFITLGKHLKNASDRYVDVDRAFTKFGDRLQDSLQDPIQAPLPDPAIAPAPIGEPARANGSDEG